MALQQSLVSFFRALLVGLFLIGAAAAPTGAAWAGQVSFAVERQSGSAVFRYRFSDAWRQVWALSFTLTFSAVEAGYRYWSGYQPEKLVEKVRTALDAYVRRYEGKVKITVTQAGYGYRIKWTHPSSMPADALGREIKQEAERAGQAYLTEHFLMRHDDAVMVDYGRMVQIFTRMLSPIAGALSAVVRGDDRQRLMIALAFIQGIPYDSTPPKRTDLGFATPPAMLWQNRGDCDTKTVALAAILGTLMPQYATVVVLVPGHALMGINMPSARGDRVYRWQGREYVLLEPVGPALTPVGQIGSTSAAALANGQGVLIVPVPR